MKIKIGTSKSWNQKGVDSQGHDTVLHRLRRVLRIRKIC